MIGTACRDVARRRRAVGGGVRARELARLLAAGARTVGVAVVTFLGWGDDRVPADHVDALGALAVLRMAAARSGRLRSARLARMRGVVARAARRAGALRLAIARGVRREAAPLARRGLGAVTMPSPHEGSEHTPRTQSFVLPGPHGAPTAAPKQSIVPCSSPASGPSGAPGSVGVPQPAAAEATTIATTSPTPNDVTTR